jgi:hypothetical protein
MGGTHADIPIVIGTCPTKSEEDFRNLNKRIEQYGIKVSRHIQSIPILPIHAFTPPLEKSLDPPLCSNY